MPQGKVKWFNNAKGYGFIIEEGGNEDLFAHFSSIQMEGYKTLKAGQRVEFEKKPSEKGVHAVGIIPLDKPERQAGASDEDDLTPGKSENASSGESVSSRRAISF